MGAIWAGPQQKNRWQFVICAVGLIAYYPFNGNANDESGYEHHGTALGATLTADRFNNENSAYSFSSYNNYITVPHNALLNITDQISVIAWIYPTSQTTQEIIRKDSNTQSVPYGLALSATGDIIFEATPNGRFTQVRHHGYALEKWSFIAGTYDETKMKLYIDGELVSTTEIEGKLNFDDNPLLIGTRLKSAAFYGKLDDIRLYNKALTDKVIAALYEAEAP